MLYRSKCFLSVLCCTDLVYYIFVVQMWEFGVKLLKTSSVLFCNISGSCWLLECKYVHMCPQAVHVCMYVCMYVCMFYIEYMYTCNTYQSTYVCMSVCVI